MIMTSKLFRINIFIWNRIINFLVIVPLIWKRERKKEKNKNKNNNNKFDANYFKINWIFIHFSLIKKIEREREKEK